MLLTDEYNPAILREGDLEVMQQQIRSDFKRFLYHGPSMMTGRQAEMALRDARILAEWRELEAQGLVRLRAEEERESYFDVFGEPETEKQRKAIIESLETYGNYWCVAEYLETVTCEVENCKCAFHREPRESWEQADSSGMCAGYRDPLDPFENCYIIGLMSSAIDKVRGQ